LSRWSFLKGEFETLINGVPATTDILTGFPSGVGASVVSAVVTDLSSTGAGPWQITYTLDSSASVADEFSVGDTLIALGSDPSGHDGKYIVTDVDSVANTVTFVVGKSVVNGRIDVDGDGNVVSDADDVGSLAGIPVIEGGLDIDRNGTIDTNDDGEVLNTTTNAAGDLVVVAYRVIDGYVDVDGDGNVAMDADDVVVIGSDPGAWVGGTVVANESDLGNGVRITIAGGVDLNIPATTTLSLDGSATLDISIPGPTVPEDVRLDFDFDMSLSETNVGTIGQANGEFSVTIDTDATVNVLGIDFPTVEVWGAAIITTDFEFLQKYGLYANAAGLLLFNNTGADKDPIDLTNAAGDTVTVVPTANTFAVRLDGSVDFRVDFNENGTFEADEQAFQLAGSFVLSFTAAEGFNVAVFSETTPGTIDPAVLRIGPAADPYLEFEAFGFLAIRSDGIAANIVLGLDAGLPGAFADVASINGRLVFMVNTTSTHVSFTIPASANNRTGSAGSDLVVAIPRAPPTTLAEFSNVSIDDLILGNAWTVPEGTDGAPYVLIHLGGTDSNPNASVNVGPFGLEGKFSFLLSADIEADDSVTVLLEIAANFELDVTIGNTTLYSLEGDGYLRFDNSGLVASLSMERRVGFEIPSTFGFSQSTSFTLELNTTSSSVNYDGRSIDPGFRLSMAGTIIIGGFSVTGLLELEIDAGGATLAIGGTIDLSFVGNLGVSGTLAFFTGPDVNDIGIAGRLVVDLNVGNNTGSTSIFFNGTASYEVNTTLRTQSVPFVNTGVTPATTTISIEPGVLVDIQARAGFNLLGKEVFSIDGRFVFSVSGDGFVIALSGYGSDPTASLTLLDDFITFQTAGALAINDKGFAAYLSLSANLNLPGGFGGVNGNFLLVINTTGEAIPIPGSTTIIPAAGSNDLTALADRFEKGLSITDSTGFVGADASVGPYFFLLYEGKLDVLGIVNFNAEGYITINPDGLIFSLSISGNFLSLVSVDGTISFNSEGEFNLHVEGGFKVGPSGFNIDVHASLDVALLDSNGINLGGDGAYKITASGRVDGTATIFFIPISVGLGISLASNGDVRVTLTAPVPGIAYACTDTFLGEICIPYPTITNKSYSFTIGRITLNPPPPPRLAKQVGSKLTVNAGSSTLRSDRNVSESEINEEIIIGQNGSGDIEVTMFGITQAFSGVTEVIINSDNGNDFVQVAENVSALVRVNLGDGEDVFIGGGVGGVVVNGQNGNDQLTGGIHAQTLNGGAHDDTITGGLGIDNVTGGSGNDIFVWTVGDGQDVVIDGGSNDVNEVDLFRLLGVDGQVLNAVVNAAPTGTGFQLVVGSETLLVTNVESLGVEAGNAADLITVNDLGGSLLDIINIDLGSDGVQDTVTVNGTNSADGFNVDFTNITVDLGGTSSTIASTNIEKVGGVSVGIFGIGSAQDELYINTLGQVDTIGVDSIGPRLQTTIDSGTGSDVITVSSSAGRLNGIDSKLIINGNLPTSGSDYLYIDDSGDSAADVYTLTSGNLSSNDLAPGGIDYSNIEHLIITLGTGADTFTIGSTHSGETIVNANNGNDIVNVRTIAGITTINGEGHVDTVNVGSSAAGTVGDANNNSGGNLAGIGALLTISGGVAAGDTLNVDDTGNSATVVGATLTSVDLVGLSFATGGSIDYGLIENLNINLGAGADTFNVQSTSAITTLRTGAGVNIVNVGSLAPGVGGTVDAIDQRLVIHGESGDDTINVDDTGELDNEIAVLTDSLLTGLGTAANDAEGIEYFGAEFMNINLGTGTDGLTIRSTSALTTVNTGIGSNPNTINVGYQVAASSNSLNAMGGKLVINGQSSGTETLNVSDSGDGDNPQNVGTMTVNRITGLGMAANDAGKGIEYYGFDDLNIDLGTGNDTFTINSTHGGTTDLTAGIGGDVINVRTISGRTSVDSGVGSDTVNVGSNASGSQGDAQNNSGGTLNGIAAFLDVEGDAPDNGSDVLTVDDTADGSSNNGTLTNSTINGLGLLESGAETGIEYTGFEHLVIALGNNGNIFTIDSTHGSAVNGYSGYQNTTSVSTGAGADLITVNDVTDTLTVNGQGGDDDVNVNGTGVGSTGNLNGDGGNDEFHIRNIDGRVYVDGGDNNDNIYVTNVVASLPGAVPQLPDTTQRTTVTAIGSVDDIDALLDVDGGTGIDRMFVDGSDAPILGRAATLTPNTLDGMGLSSEGIDYRGLDFLTIWMDAGSNTLTVNDTHAGTTSVYMSDGSDIVDVNDASGLVNIYGEQAADIFNIRATALNSTLNLRGHEGNDTFNISNLAPTVPQGDYPVGAGPPGTDEYAETPLVAQEIGSVDAIDGLVDIEGGSEADQLNIDDSANLNAKRGTLTSNTLRGMDMPGGVNYRDVEDLNLWLGTNSDILYVDGTHAGTTQIYGGDGITGIADNDYGTPNRDDTIAINTIAGETTIYGQGGNDLILVNVTENTPGGAFVRTHGNGISAANLNLTGNGGSDEYIINLSGLDTAIVNVHDYGSPYDGVDRLVINGADGTATEDDTFLLRKNFVALLNESASSTTGFDQVERVNYDQNINERLVVNGLGGADRFVADDNSSVTTLDGGAGMDSFQIGQIFATLRSADAAAFNQIAPGDEFDTTRVIIGIIRNPDTGEVIFDPSTDQLNAAKILEIESHIDPITGYLAGIAYVSDGVSQPTTVYGGDDDDSFSVYQNKGTLRLEGEANNDSFVVRAFVLLPKVTNTGTGELEELEEQAETEVKGGADDDTIQYAINAPVSIDGGTGFDTVVVLGTPFPDAFVVNSQGIFGAGLNVTFENVESAELDALEGDDQIYVLGTNADLVTLIIGGQGSDTISVMGDVVSDIVSNDLLGRAGLITHRFTAGSGAFANVGVNGVDASVVGADSGSLVDISAAGIRGALAEDSGSTLEYFIQLTNPAAGQATLGSSVYLTVSAGLVSSKDQETDGESVLVSLDGVTWSKSVVLTFDETGTRQSVFVKAIDDPAAEGPRLALISHSINSTDAAYDDLALPDVLIDVVDDDKAGIDIRLFEEIGGVEVVDAITEVLEGVGGFSDIYRIALTRAPNAGETVTVNLSASDRLSYFDKDGVEITSLTFNASTWDTAQLVRVVANDNGDVDGTGFVTITHAITSTGGLYSGILEEAYPTLDVKVFDDESAGAIIRQSDGRTIVVANGVDAYDADDDDSYRVRLTQEITSGVVQLQLFTDQQTELVTDSRLQFVGANNSQGTFEYVLTFNASNWDDWYEVRVVANEQFVADGGQPLKTFTPQDQNLDQIAGPLVIEGGVIEGRDRTFAPALLLPGEQDDSVFQDTNADQSGDIDRLDIFHTDSTAAESGALDAVTNPLDNTDLDQWTLLTGFETDRLGAQLKINEGTEDVPEYVFYDRGISFNGFEIVEVLLGKGHETLDVNATPDDAITIIHGGGGDDTINIFDRGNGPLVVYGDTSEDRVRYSNDSAFASRNGSVFTNDGDDTINAFAMADEDDEYVGLVIYGGFGDDTIDGSQDDDHIAGGTGSDTIRAHGGNDHVYGDSHFNIDPDLFAQDRVTPFADAADEVEDMFIVLDVTPGDDQDILDPQVFIEAAGEDEIEGGAGSDTIFGDHGRIDLVQGTRRIATTDFVQTVTTTLPDIGKVDTVSGDAGGDVIFGGQDGDIIDGGNGDNIVFGDHGEVDYGPDSGDIESLKSITRTDHGGADVITAGSGNDIVIGGRFGDTIRSGGGADIVLGDHGDLIYGPVMPGDSNTLSQIISTQLTDGDIDIIFGEAGDDVIIGGLDDDLLDGGADSDLIFGDAVTLEHRPGDTSSDRFRTLLGEILYSRTEIPTVLQGIPDAPAGNESGEALVDTIAHNYREPGGNQPFWTEFEVIDLHHSATEEAAGWDAAGFGDDYIAGGAGNDMIFGQLGDDVIQGDGSINSAVGATRNLIDEFGLLVAKDLPGQLSELIVQPSVDSADDGDDYIEGNGGSDVIFGNLGQDDIVGGSSNMFSLIRPELRPDAGDILFGGSGTEIDHDELFNDEVNDLDTIIPPRCRRHCWRQRQYLPHRRDKFDGCGRFPELRIRCRTRRL
jgi:Ca2+-binding RTX toxin-like protein